MSRGYKWLNKQGYHKVELSDKDLYVKIGKEGMDFYSAYFLIDYEKQVLLNSRLGAYLFWEEYIMAIQEMAEDDYGFELQGIIKIEPDYALKNYSDDIMEFYEEAQNES